MYIARQLKKKNIAEYLLYMWQVEDIIRANNLDIDKIRKNIIEQYGSDENSKKELEQWYSELIDMIRSENVQSSGHLQINKNVIINLTDLHNELLSSTKEPFYNTAYFKALPFIVEIRQKSGKTDEPEIENCFDALYGIMLLKLQKKEISADTQKAIGEITKFISLLANYYDKSIKGELKLD